jgi:hypothetical protein
MKMARKRTSAPWKTVHRMRNLSGKLDSGRSVLLNPRKPAKPPEIPKSSHRFVTTAIAKIPLSVALVKHEPQYVVFC